MWTRHHKKRRTGALIVPALAVCFLTYFGFHAYHGDYGIYAKYRLEDRIVHLKRDLASVEERRLELERRVRLLHDGSMERDMLDEHVRRALNMAHPNDVIIMRGELN
ncbi:MAG: FtsB family cell division protein [Rhizobiaceae bacterium]